MRLRQQLPMRRRVWSTIFVTTSWMFALSRRYWIVSYAMVRKVVPSVYVSQHWGYLVHSYTIVKNKLQFASQITFLLCISRCGLFRVRLLAHSHTNG